MKESILKSFNFILLAISFIMFSYQAMVAVNQFLNPPVVDSTETSTITDIEPPLITICPMGQFYDGDGEGLGYDGLHDLLIGQDTLNIITAWGAQYNMTFEELNEEIENLDKDFPKLEFRMDDGPLMKADYEKRYYPSFGRCIDFSNYTITGNLELTIHIDTKSTYTYSLNGAVVFLTDKKLRTRNTVHKPSHWGPSIFIQETYSYEYMVKVEQLSNFDPRKPEECKEYTDGEFENCVDEELQDLWKPILGCNPPWLSSKHQCNSIMNTTEIDDLLHNRTFKTFTNIRSMKSYAAKERCTKPCTEVRNTIFKNEHNFFGLGNYAIFNLVFDDIVVLKTKMLAYGFSDFLIDMGSSLGLWFGLSVFGIRDVVIMVIQWTEKIRTGAFKKYFD